MNAACRSSGKGCMLLSSLLSRAPGGKRHSLTPVQLTGALEDTAAGIRSSWKRIQHFVEEFSSHFSLLHHLH